MAHRTKILLFVTTLFLVSSLVIVGCGQAPQSVPGGSGPIVIGYVGNTSSPGTRPCMDIQQMAVDEINAAGGVLGRPLKLVLEDGKGETGLSVAAAQRLVMGNKALIYFSEGRSEIALAAREKSADMYSSFPHISITNGAADYEVTEGILDKYDRYKFFFRDFEFAQYPWYYGINMKMMRDTIKAKKIAILFEDLIWTRVYREGDPKLGTPPMKKNAEDTWGLQVVYEKPIKARSGMWLPTLEAISQTGAESIFVLSSWFTDVEVLTKQWSDSSAKNIQLIMCGGSGQSHQFWGMTGGKCLGAIVMLWEEDKLPIFPAFNPTVQKAMSKNIPVQFHVLCAYNDIYLAKKAIETAGGTDDVGKVINAYETVNIDGVFGPFGYWGMKKDPWFHSGVITNPDDVYTWQYKTSYCPFNQIQGKDNYVLLQTQEGDTQQKFARPDLYKSPAELRAAAK
ncbi:MAG: ABC transporter substrate-binding protein [Dehalococcoidia bacterium]|nr:ABC transporter substrate-binding protein [Dehalococcoidia bacterium]MDD5495105.1 ABC transporter substrate-binding protein [Dehalococcoidia bacterium]